jgi:hypothetical protein
MANMNLEGTRRVMETSSHETANQYLRFGWNLINQYVVEASEDQPATMRFVLASVRRLEDTREVLTLNDIEVVNAHLTMGWRLIEKHVTAGSAADQRDERLHFTLAWQSDDPPLRPGVSPPVLRQFDLASGEPPSEAIPIADASDR